MTHLKFLLTSSVAAVSLTLAACQPSAPLQNNSASEFVVSSTNTAITEAKQKISKDWQYLENAER